MTADSSLQAAVEQYKRLRSVGRGLSHRMVQTLPRKALDDIGKALGILHKGTFVFNTMDMTSVLMDCCLYDWIDGGKNIVQKFADSHVFPAGSDEAILLDAYQRARYRVLLSKEWLPGAGIRAADVFTGEELFLMDINLSRCQRGPYVLTTRTIPLDGYWMTGGAPLMVDADALELAIRRIGKAGLVVRGIIADEHRLALTMVRACLDSGVAERVRFEDAGSWSDPEAQRSLGGGRAGQGAARRGPGRNSPCPCGSGKRYKGCCARRGLSQPLAPESRPSRPEIHG